MGRHRLKKANHMLDPHEPHEPIHTWKGFLIHFSAVAMGLLLTLGPEQTIEAARPATGRLQ
jgi:hypothetical protein